jgi:hypothetical protein
MAAGPCRARARWMGPEGARRGDRGMALGIVLTILAAVLIVVLQGLLLQRRNVATRPQGSRSHWPSGSPRRVREGMKPSKRPISVIVTT